MDSLDPFASIISSLGVGGASVWFIMLMISKWSARKDKMQESEIVLAEKKAAAELNFQEFFTTISKTIGLINSKMDSVLGHSSDDLSLSGSRNYFGIWAGKIHYEIFFWYQNRIKENHILENPEVISKKYSDMLGSVISKWRYQLEIYRNQGEILLLWDPEMKGFTEIYRKLFSQLYQDQIALASGKSTYFKDPMIELDHIQSMIMGASVRWSTSRKSLCEDLEDSENSKKTQIDIEFLNAENSITKGASNEL